MWSEGKDLKNLLVSYSMRQIRFAEILRSIYFEDRDKSETQGKQNTDKMWKLRPITDYTKENILKNFRPKQNLSFNERTIPYFGLHNFNNL